MTRKLSLVMDKDYLIYIYIQIQKLSLLFDGGLRFWYIIFVLWFSVCFYIRCCSYQNLTDGFVPLLFWSSFPSFVLFASPHSLNCACFPLVDDVPTSVSVFVRYMSVVIALYHVFPCYSSDPSERLVHTLDLQLKIRVDL